VNAKTFSEAQAFQLHLCGKAYNHRSTFYRATSGAGARRTSEPCARCMEQPLLDFASNGGLTLMQSIALISEHASPLAVVGGIDAGGQNIYVAQVARQLARLGYTVDVFTRRDSTRLAETVDYAPGVRVVNVPAGPAQYVRKEDMLPLMKEFGDFVCDFARGKARRGEGYRVSHANFFMSAIASLRLKECLGTPFVVTFHALGRVRRMHQGDADQFPRERLEIEDQTISRADAIIAECPQDRTDLTTLYRADERRVSVIPCGFDQAEFWPITKPFARRALGFCAHDRILLNVGRLAPRKGLDNLVRGLGQLARGHGISARLIIVGGNSDLPDPAVTPEMARLQAVAAEEGVERQVHFTGRRSREFLKLYYSAADVFATTPWYEPFGITPLEAMACGTPVIGADVGGIRFSVADGVTGVLVPPEDPPALAAAAARLLADPQLMREMGRSGMQRVQAQFTWPKVARSIASLYDRVAPRSRARVAVIA
jgi:glycosyltransferase involved in cell wall biosynthesis